MPIYVISNYLIPNYLISNYLIPNYLIANNLIANNLIANNLIANIDAPDQDALHRQNGTEEYPRGAGLRDFNRGGEGSLAEVRPGLHRNYR